MAVLLASVVSFFSIPIAGHLSDRFGRKRVYIRGAVITGLFGWVYFALLNTPAPLIAAALFASYRSWVALSVYITVCAAISVVATALMQDYTGKDISAEYVFGEPNGKVREAPAGPS